MTEDKHYEKDGKHGKPSKEKMVTKNKKYQCRKRLLVSKDQ